jgi:hypothetical protein
MARLSYAIVTIDLAVAVANPTPVPKVDIGTTYSGVIVLQLPAGNAVNLFFSPSGDAVPLLIQGQAFSFEDDDGCPFFCDEGLFFSNPVAGAGLLVLMIPFKQGKGA